MSFEVAVLTDSDPAATFDALFDELRSSLLALGLIFEPGPSGGIFDGEERVGRVTEWARGRSAKVVWKTAPWTRPGPVEISFLFMAKRGGTAVRITVKGWKKVVGTSEDLLGWLSGRVLGEMLAGMTPRMAGDWVTDRMARMPSGPGAREAYKDPSHHRPNFLVILETLKLKRKDRLLEVGCGGGALLADALRSGCTAAGVDHSPDMVRAAGELNARAVAEGRLDVRLSEAYPLPFRSGEFTCAIMTNVANFLEDLGAALKELRRVLRPGGRLVVFLLGKEARSTIAAPEPVASRVLMYDDGELVRLAEDAGFVGARVSRPDLYRYAKAAGLSQGDLLHFKTERGRRPVGQLLHATKALGTRR